MGEAVVASHLWSRSSLMLREAEAHSGTQSHIISQFRNSTTAHTGNEIPVKELYELVDLLSDFNVFTIQPHRRILPFFRNFFFNQKLKNKLDTIRRNIQTPKDRRPAAGLVIHETNPPRDSSSIVGFEEEIKKIEIWLTAGGEKEVDGVRAKGIVGRCGSGKTSLAKKVFDSPAVVEQFSPRIWVCLSEMLLETKDVDPRVEVVNRMLEWIDHAVKQKKSERSLDKKLRKLRNRLTGKRYLIVLDDAWRVDDWYAGIGGASERLGSLSYGLPKGSGGAVIVTGRRKSVIGEIVGDNHVTPLQGVAPEFCWCIFSAAVRHRQQGRNGINENDLSTIKDDAIRVFDGLPFAAKTLGDMILGGEAKNQLNPRKPADNGGGTSFEEDEAKNQVKPREAKNEVISNQVEEIRLALMQVLKDAGEASSQEPHLQGPLTHVQKAVDQLTSISPVGETLSQRNLHDDYRGSGFSQAWMDLGVESMTIGNDAISTLNNTFSRLQLPQSKICSFCLSVFPDAAVIKKRPLIYWWIGEGLVAAEEVGERVFQELLEEGFLKLKPTTTNSFTVSPWIRLMLIWLAKNSGFLEFTSGMPCDSQRRTFLLRENTEKKGNEGEKGNEVEKGNAGERDNVRTVININVQYLGYTADWLRQLTNVEVLQMGRWQESAPHHIEVEDYKKLLFNGLGSQKHLKYLSLRGISRIESLPPSITKLVSLQILDLRACHNLESLPDGMAELKKLTHLDVSECYLLETMPKGLERLSNLQVLKGFVVGNPAKNACKISDMTQLSKLRKLSLRVLKHDNQQMETLKNFAALQILSISWSVVEVGDTAVSLPVTLTKLNLRCVPFAEVPEWMQASKVPKLLKLYITGGKLKSINNQDYNNRNVEVRHKYPCDC